MNIKKAINLILQDKITLKYFLEALEKANIRGALTFEGGYFNFIGYDYKNQKWIEIKG